MVEQRIENPCVPGSNPGGTTPEGSAQALPFFVTFVVMSEVMHSPEQRLAHGLMELRPDCVAWIHEDVLAPLLLEHYESTFRESGIQCLHVAEMQGGEQAKRWESLPQLFDLFGAWGLTRRSVVLTTGGGALSDAVGMAASLWKRGMRVIHMPTTPLAAVDAAWGGKTAFNWRGAKNQVGTIHLPEHVHLDARWMETLAPREFNAGLAEAVKHAMLDPKALTWMQNHDTPRAEDTNWEEMTRWFEHMSLTKRTIVDADLNEQGERNQLNLGHTVAHALEAATADQGEPLLHGEAVAVGLRFALFEASEGVLSKEPLGEESAADSTWIEQWLQSHLPLPELNWPTAEVLWPWMIQDKKNVHVEVRDMAWRGVGQIHWPVTWEKSAFEATWTRFLRLTFNET